MNRRHFIRNSSMAAAALMAANTPLSAMAREEAFSLLILHTNDQHSRLDPFPMDGSKYQGLGGIARREAMVEKYRQSHEQVLLLDSGDIWQGTPYFNKYQGRPEFELMSRMQYDAATLGNHDFDNGVEGLARMLPFAGFPFLNCNYRVEDSALEGKIQPWKIIQKGKIKVGIFGLGIELNGLVLPANYGSIRYENPITRANETAQFLKKEMGCHLLICLSHLGYEYKDRKVSDVILAENTKDIDIILGGHTHTFLPEPVGIRNSAGKITLINQVGWAGIMLGRIELFFGHNKMRETGRITPEKIL